MSTHDRNTDGEQTAAWPGDQSAPSAPPVVPPTVPQPAGTPPPGNPPTTTGGWGPPTPPAPPGGYPPAGYPAAYGQSPAAPPPSPKGSKKGLLAVLAIIVILAAAAAVIFFTPLSDKLLGKSSTTTSASTSSSSTTASPTSPATPGATSAPSPSATAAPPPGPGAAAPVPGAVALIDPADLQSYLATPDELSQRFAGADMQPQGLTKQPVTDIEVSPFKCSSAAVPGMSSAYSGAGFTGFIDQVVNDSTGQHKFIQALITFPTADAAKDFVSRQASQWKDCGNTNLTITIAGKSDHANTAAASTTTDGVTTIVLTPPAAGSRQCERAITASSNVVVDVRACAVNVGTAASTVARDIGQKITGPR